MDVVSLAARVLAELVSWVPAVLGDTGGLLVSIALLGVVGVYELGMAAGSRRTARHRRAFVATGLLLSVVFGALVVHESLVVLGVV